MKIFDCHCHIEEGLEGYDIQAERMNVIFNSLENYRNFENKVPEGSVITIILDLRRPQEVMELCKNDPRIRGLKIHSRIQRLTHNDYSKLNVWLNEFDSAMPVIYDAFYYGHELEYQPNLGEFIHLARNHTDRNFVVAHAGGHKTLEYLLQLRTLKNIYYDLSFSLAYLEGTSVAQDLYHLIKVTHKKRIIFGTDFPHIEVRKQFDIASKLVLLMELTPEDTDLIFYENAASVFGVK